jgi:hypothetical protein
VQLLLVESGLKNVAPIVLHALSFGKFAVANDHK